VKKNYLTLLRILTAALIVVVAGVAIWNKINLDKCSRHNQILRNKIGNAKAGNQKIETAVIKAHTVSMKHLGKTIKMGKDLKQVFPEKPVAANKARHPKLLLVFNELGCNVCMDSETQFGVSIASEYGQDYVMAIVHATNQRYVRNYIRMNQVNFPIFFCEDESFQKQNNIKNTPMILVLDKENKVIASHFPIPGQLQYSEPVHQFCYHYFNKN